MMLDSLLSIAGMPLTDYLIAHHHIRDHIYFSVLYSTSDLFWPTIALPCSYLIHK